MIAILARFGLFVLLAIFVGVVAANWKQRPVTVDVLLVDDEFKPDKLKFTQDVRYRLHLANHGKDTHEFTAPTFFATADIENPAALNREHTEIVLQPGETKDLLFTPRRPGDYDLRCSDHDWDGMVGGITVVPQA
jgi:uncharacterized cupredoxin-like copper-binding protein